MRKYHVICILAEDNSKHTLWTADTYFEAKDFYKSYIDIAYCEKIDCIIQLTHGRKVEQAYEVNN